MRLIGFNFTKINAEKKSNDLKKLNLTVGIDISDIKKAESKIISSSEEILLIGFEYKINYEKDIASLLFNGNMIISVDSSQAKEILTQWKDKKISEEIRTSLFNIILKKASIKAFQFEDELNLPPHIPLPTFKPSEKKK